MSEYIAVMLGLGMVTFYMLDFGFRLLEVDQDKKRHDAISLFLVMGSMVMLWLLLNTAQKISVDAGMSAAVQNALGYAYWASIVFGTVVMIYFVLRMMIAPMMGAIKQKKLRVEDDE